MSRLRVLYITPPDPHSFSHSSKGSSFLAVSRAPPIVWGGGGAREREIKERYRAAESVRHLGTERYEDDDEYGDAPPPISFPLCLIMSRLVLILPSDASHFIKGLTFTCNSQTGGGVPISFCVQERSARSIGYERLILSPHRAEEAGWFVLVLSVMITSCRLCQLGSDVKGLMCFFRCQLCMLQKWEEWIFKVTGLQQQHMRPVFLDRTNAAAVLLSLMLLQSVCRVLSNAPVVQTSRRTLN